MKRVSSTSIAPKRDVWIIIVTLLILVKVIHDYHGLNSI